MKNLKKFEFFLFKKEFYYGVFITNIVVGRLLTFILEMFPNFFDLEFSRPLFKSLSIIGVVSLLGLLPATVRFFTVYIREQQADYKEIAQK